MKDITRDDVTAWVNPVAWDDEAEAERVIDAILESGSDSEAEWVRIAGGGADDVAAAAQRDEVRDSERADARLWTMPDIAARLGVAHETVRSWLYRGQLPAPAG